MKRMEHRDEFEAALESTYGVGPEAVADLAFYVSEGKRVYASGLDLDPEAPRARVERVGVYFAAWEEFGLRLSLDGAPLVADHANPEHVLELPRSRAEAWLRGEPLHRPESVPGPYVLLTHAGRVVGCGLARGPRIHNRVSKNRRIPHPRDTKPRWARDPTRGGGRWLHRGPGDPLGRSRRVGTRQV